MYITNFFNASFIEQLPHHQGRKEKRTLELGEKNSKDSPFIKKQRVLMGFHPRKDTAIRINRQHEARFEKIGFIAYSLEASGQNSISFSFFDRGLARNRKWRNLNV